MVKERLIAKLIRYLWWPRRRSGDTNKQQTNRESWSGNQRSQLSASDEPSLLAQAKFETCDTKYGRLVRFTQPAGFSLRAMMEAINAETAKQHGRLAIRSESLRFCVRLDTVPFSDGTHELVPVVTGSNGRSSRSQSELLDSRKMISTDLAIVIVAAGLFRLANGFPSDSTMIGKVPDKGDLLKGFVVRGEDGTLTTEAVGLDVRDPDRSDGRAFVDCYASGSPRRPD